MPRAVCDSMKEPKMRRTNVSKRYALSSLITSKLPKRLYQGFIYKKVTEGRKMSLSEVERKGFLSRELSGNLSR